MEKPKTKLERVLEDTQVSSSAKVLYTWLYIHRENGERVNGRWEMMICDDELAESLGVTYSTLNTRYLELYEHEYIRYTRKCRTWTTTKKLTRRITLL